MGIYVLDKDSVIKQATQNLVEAGLLEPHEAPEIIQCLQHLSPMDLITILMESHSLRELAQEHGNFYPIDVSAISLN